MGRTPPAITRDWREIREALGEARDAQIERYEDSKKILDRADREKRDLRGNELREFEDLKEQMETGRTEIHALEKELDDYNTAMAPARRLAHGPVDGGRPSRDTVTLGREQRMADWASNAVEVDRSGFTAADADDFCIGNVMRALVQPDFRKHLSDVEQRALAEGTNSAGGFLTPEILSVNVIDRIRNEMTVVQAGATTVPLNSDQQSIPRLSGGVTGAWRTENSAFADTQPTFDRVSFTPQSYGFLVKTSEELYQDMVPGGGQILEREFAAAAALEIDRVALRGTGTAPEPRGVRNQSGVTVQSLGTNGATPTYAHLMTSLATLLGSNRKPNAIIMAPRTTMTYGGLADTTGQPLNPPLPVAELWPPLVSNQIPTNLTQGSSSVASETYVGYWPDLLLGIRLGFQLRLLTERYADTGQYAWRVFLRMDVQLQHPESFVVETGVIP